MGTYADSLLTSGEEVLMRERQHWLSLVLDSRLAILLWALALVAIVLRIVTNDPGAIGTTLIAAGTIAFILGVIYVAWRWLKWRASEYVITNRRLINATGIVNKRSADSSLEKINDAVLEVNLLGRWLGYGDLDILTAADSGIDRYRMLNHATQFKKTMMAAKHALDSDNDGMRRRPATSGPGMAGAPGTAAVAATVAAPAAGVDAAAGPAGSAAGSTAGAPPKATYASGGDDPRRADTPEEVTQLLEQLTRLRDAGHISAEEYAAKKQDLLGRL